MNSIQTLLPQAHMPSCLAKEPVEPCSLVEFGFFAMCRLQVLSFSERKI